MKRVKPKRKTYKAFSSEDGALMWFDLPKDAKEYDITSNALGWAFSAWEMDRILRGWVKNGHDFKTPDEALQAAHDELLKILATNEVDLDDID